MEEEDTFIFSLSDTGIELLRAPEGSGSSKVQIDMKDFFHASSSFPPLYVL